MIWLARGLRIALIGVCLFVLSGIIPLSLEHFRTGNACPMVGPIPACYIVAAAYSAMAVAGVIWWQVALKLFLIGGTPVIALALIGSVTEFFGTPTCPRTAGGLPLCYLSLAIGTGLLLTFLAIRWMENNSKTSVG